MAKKQTARPAAEPKQQLGARIPAALHRRLNHYTIDHKMSVAEAVTQAVEEYLKKRGA